MYDEDDGVPVDPTWIVFVYFIVDFFIPLKNKVTKKKKKHLWLMNKK